MTTNAAGNYVAVATNSAGTATSSVAVLTVYNTAAATLSSLIYSKQQFKLSLGGVSNYSYVIQASTNLTTWTNVTTNTAPFTFTDSTVTNYPTRYYRALH